MAERISQDLVTPEDHHHLELISGSLHALVHI
jgi:hypothetical protein